MSHIARIGYLALALTVVAVGAWAYGRSGTAPLRDELEAKRLRLMLVEARAQVLDAQVSLYTANFGNASRHLEYARSPLSAASSVLATAGRPEAAAKVDAALTQLSSAQELANKLNQDANSRASEAGRLLAEVLTMVPR